MLFRSLAENEAALLAEATIHSRTVTTEQDTAAVRLRAEYVCTENIAVEIPLQSG